MCKHPRSLETRRHSVKDMGSARGVDGNILTQAIDIPFTYLHVVGAKPEAEVHLGTASLRPHVPLNRPKGGMALVA